ncbi:MAG: ATP-binding protein, partial [Burkholderiales bacterium]|nr:ATP-binding protein [Burkholderiales bacterium]
IVVSAFSHHGFQFVRESPQPFPIQVSNWLSRQERSSIVLLVDEYDAPLTEYIDDSASFSLIWKQLSNFYTVIGSNEKCFRFLFITGIANFCQTSLFRNIRNLRDLSCTPSYAHFLGFTSEELKANFTDYLSEASTTLNIREQELIDKLIGYYSGYSFVLNYKNYKSHISPPWSILSFLSDPLSGFLPYWFNSGGEPEILQQCFSTDAQTNFIQFVQGISVPVNFFHTTLIPEHLDKLALLAQTGYLTIKAFDPMERIVTLGFPNDEVKKSVGSLYLSQLLNRKTLTEVGACGILKDFKENDSTSVVMKLNNAFRTIDHEGFSLISGSRVRTATMLILQGAGLDVSTEGHNVKGRSDLEYTIGSVHWVVELKYVKEKQDLEKVLNVAKNQIFNRHYGEQTATLSIRRLVLIFSASEREIVRHTVCTA